MPRPPSNTLQKLARDDPADIKRRRQAEALGLPPLDMVRLQAEYESGSFTIAELGELHRRSHQAISALAKRKGWTRRLKPAVDRRVEELEQYGDEPDEDADPPERVETLDERRERLIEATAHAIIRIKSFHREHIGMARGLAARMLAELDETTALAGKLLKFAESMVVDSDEARQEVERAIKRATSLAGRAKTLDVLSNVLKTLIALEREAYGITSAGPEQQTTSSDPPDNQGAREIAYALHRGLQLVKAGQNQQSPAEQQAAS